MTILVQFTKLTYELITNIYGFTDVRVRLYDSIFQVFISVKSWIYHEYV